MAGDSRGETPVAGESRKQQASPAVAPRSLLNSLHQPLISVSLKILPITRRSRPFKLAFSSRSERIASSLSRAGFGAFVRLQFGVKRFDSLVVASPSGLRRQSESLVSFPAARSGHGKQQARAHSGMSLVSPFTPGLKSSRITIGNAQASLWPWRTSRPLRGGRCHISAPKRKATSKAAVFFTEISSTWSNQRRSSLRAQQVRRPGRAELALTLPRRRRASPLSDRRCLASPNHR